MARLCLLLVSIMGLIVSLTGCSGGPSTLSGSTTTASFPVDGTLSTDALGAVRLYEQSGTLFDVSARFCAAPKMVRALGAARLRQIAQGSTPSSAEAEAMYESFKDCVTRNVIISDVESHVPNLQIDQSRCLLQNGPTEADAKPILIARIEGRPDPSLPADEMNKLQNVLRDCLTVDQIRNMSASN